MQIISFSLSIVFILLIILSPFIFKAIFKNKTFISLGIGFFCAIIYVIIIIGDVALFILVFYVAAFSGSKVNGSGAITAIFLLGFFYRLFAWLFYAIPHVLLLVALLCFIKMSTRKEKNFSSIFMFISGFNIIFIFAFIGTLYLSVLNNTNNYTYGSIEQIGIIIIQLAVLSFMMLYDSCSIMFMLHYRKVNGYILWIGIISLLLPSICVLLSVSLNVEFFSIISVFTPIISFILAIIFYNIYSGKDNLENNGFLQPCSIGVEEED